MPSDQGANGERQPDPTMPDGDTARSREEAERLEGRSTESTDPTDPAATSVGPDV